MKKLPPWAKSFKNWLGLVVVVYAATALIGIEVPRPTWFSEHLVLAGEVTKNSIAIAQGTVESYRRQLTEIRIQLSKVPPGRLRDSLYRSETEVKADLDTAKARLEKMRGY